MSDPVESGAQRTRTVAVGETADCQSPEPSEEEEITRLELIVSYLLRLGVALSLWHRYLDQPRLSPETSGAWERPGSQVHGAALPRYADGMNGSYLGPRSTEAEIQQLVDERAIYAHLWQLGFLHGVGPRVKESGLGLISGFAYSGPYEDLTLSDR